MQLATIPFWKTLERHGDLVALIDGSTGETWSYTRLAQDVASVATLYTAEEKGLALIRVDNRVADIISYLGALYAGAAVAVYSSKSHPPDIHAFIETYRPTWISAGLDGLERNGNYVRSDSGLLVPSKSSPKAQINPTLGLLLSTSGSTASAKFVRLSYGSVDTNAKQISRALRIGPSERSCTSLPLIHILGLSVLHSHLTVGASIVVQDRPVSDPDFWKAVKRFKVSSITGVPSTYEVIKSLGTDRIDVSTIRKLASSGDKLPKYLSDWLLQCSSQSGIQIYSMYGQTEAGGRMTVLPPDAFSSKRNSVGLAVPDGSVTAASDGTIEYHGPNVMLGYASKLEDLERGDDQKGRLDTGDLGFIDADGHLFITGRKSRLCKIYGVRLSLDYIQEVLSSEGNCIIATSEIGSNLIVLSYTPPMTSTLSSSIDHLRRGLQLPANAISLRPVNALSCLPSGKLKLTN